MRPSPRSISGAFQACSVVESVLWSQSSRVSAAGTSSSRKRRQEKIPDKSFLGKGPSGRLQPFSIVPPRASWHFSEAAWRDSSCCWVEVIWRLRAVAGRGRFMFGSKVYLKGRVALRGACQRGNFLASPMTRGGCWWVGLRGWSLWPRGWRGAPQGEEFIIIHGANHDWFGFTTWIRLYQRGRSWGRVRCDGCLLSWRGCRRGRSSGGRGW